MRSVITRWSNLVPLRSTGQNLNRGFVVLLRKSIPQNRNLNCAVYHGVMLALLLGFSLKNGWVLRSGQVSIKHHGISYAGSFVPGAVVWRRG